MSGMALIWATNVKGLKPAAKIVLIQLVDFHNKETGQSNTSAKRLADECETGRATLFRHMTTLEQCGPVTRHARGDGDGGRGSNQYELHLDITLGPSSRRKGGASGPNGVVYQNETGGNVSNKRGKGPSGETGVVPYRNRNLTIEPVKEPPPRKREDAGNLAVEKILAAYPSDSLRDKLACLAQIGGAVKEGIAAEETLLAVQAYQNAFDSLRDVRNQRHGWADPMELERVQEVRVTIETATRAQGRKELHAWILVKSTLA
jgi:hypothetical protein